MSPTTIRQIEFFRYKYGAPLLVDVADVGEMPSFIQTREPHALAFTELMLVHGGAGTLSLDGVDLPVLPGAAFVTGPAQVRSWRLSAPLRATTVFFEEAFLDATTVPRFAVTLKTAQFARLHSTLRSLAGQLGSHGPSAGALLRSALAGVLRTLPQRTPVGALTRRFVRLVDRHWSEHRRVADYARLLGVTPEHLCRVVRTESDRPASAVIHGRLVLEAQRALLYSAETVSRLAERLQFCDASYLTRFFKRHLGLSPSEFRRLRRH